MTWLQTQAFNFVIPMLLGPIVYVMMKGLKQGSSWIDLQSPAIKRTLVVAVAIIVTAATNLLGQPITCDTNAQNAADCLNQLTPEVLKALLAAGTAMVLHALKKTDPNK